MPNPKELVEIPRFRTVKLKPGESTQFNDVIYIDVVVTKGNKAYIDKGIYTNTTTRTITLKAYYIEIPSNECIPQTIKNMGFELCDSKKGLGCSGDAEAFSSGFVTLKTGKAELTDIKQFFRYQLKPGDFINPLVYKYLETVIIVGARAYVVKGYFSNKSRRTINVEEYHILKSEDYNIRQVLKKMGYKVCDGCEYPG